VARRDRPRAIYFNSSAPFAPAHLTTNDINFGGCVDVVVLAARGSDRRTRRRNGGCAQLVAGRGAPPPCAGRTVCGWQRDSALDHSRDADTLHLDVVRSAAAVPFHSTESKENGIRTNAWLNCFKSWLF